MNYAVEVRLGAIIYIRSFVNIGLGIQSCWGDTHINTQTHIQQDDIISLLLFFQNYGSRLKIKNNIF
jgi:hypothetical protein